MEALLCPCNVCKLTAEILALVRATRIAATIAHKQSRRQTKH
jgi:hypothetical protein